MYIPSMFHKILNLISGLNVFLRLKYLNIFLCKYITTMKSKKVIYNCKIVQSDNVIHEGNYHSLQEIAEDLGLTLDMISNIKTGRTKDKKWNNFRYKQDIQILKM